MLVSQNKGMAAILVYKANPLGIELYFYANTFFCFIEPIWPLVTWVKTIYTNWYIFSSSPIFSTHLQLCYNWTLNLPVHEITIKTNFNKSFDVIVIVASFIRVLGGFYSDVVGHVDTSCKKCPNGSFVAYDKAPGTRFQDCKTCPLGS